MSMFTALDAAKSGASLADTWMTAIAHNIANSNTVLPPGVEPFRAQQVHATPSGSMSGVRVSAISERAGTPDRVFDPGNPLADAEGYVTRPVVDMTTELTGLVVAQRLYQANLSVHKQVTESYRNALTIGRA